MVVNFVGEYQGDSLVICEEAGDGTVVFGVIGWSAFMDKGGCSYGEPFWGCFRVVDYFIGGFCECGMQGCEIFNSKVLNLVDSEGFPVGQFFGGHGELCCGEFCPFIIFN